MGKGGWGGFAEESASRRPPSPPPPLPLSPLRCSHPPGHSQVTAWPVYHFPPCPTDSALTMPKRTQPARGSPLTSFLSLSKSTCTRHTTPYIQSHTHPISSVQDHSTHTRHAAIFPQGAPHFDTDVSASAAAMPATPSFLASTAAATVVASPTVTPSALAPAVPSTPPDRFMRL